MYSTQSKLFLFCTTIGPGLIKAFMIVNNPKNLESITRIHGRVYVSSKGLAQMKIKKLVFSDHTKITFVTITILYGNIRT